MRATPRPLPFFLRPVARGIAGKMLGSCVNPQIKLHLDFMESGFGRSTWFAGAAFSAADIQMSFPIEAAAARGALGAGHPRLQAYLAAIHARPAYQRALAMGGAYEPLR